MRLVRIGSLRRALKSTEACRPMADQLFGRDSDTDHSHLSDGFNFDRASHQDAQRTP